MKLLSILLMCFSVEYAFAENNFATQKDIEELKFSISVLKSRIEVLEVNNAQNPHPNTVDGKNPWKMLKKGMSKKKITELLGEPGKKTSGSYGETWFYPDVLGGQVSFNKHGSAFGWNEP